jgi:hypothetical protein
VYLGYGDVDHVYAVPFTSIVPLAFVASCLFLTLFLDLDIGSYHCSVHSKQMCSRDCLVLGKVRATRNAYQYIF